MKGAPAAENEKPPAVKKDAKKCPAEANTALADTAVVDREKKPKTTNANLHKSVFKSYVCGTNGHTADFCRTYLLGNKSGEFGKGTAQLAENDEQEDDE